MSFLPYEPSPFTSEGQAYIELREELRRTQDECAHLQSLINTPHTHDFIQAVQLEMPHQRERWGNAHDAGKTPADWFWLVGYLAGKALHAVVSGNVEKAKHHVVTSAAALGNWFLAITGENTAMRPGIEPPASSEESRVIGSGAR